MEKLNGEQILQKLEELFGDGRVGIDNYAFNNFLAACPDDFKFSEETQKVKREKDEAYSNYSNTDRGTEENDRRLKLWREKENPIPLMEQEFLTSVGLGKVNEVEQVGGEGEGNTWYTVKHFVDHDVYIRTDGWYSSYEGTEFEDGFGEVVSPKEKTITVYE